jgi:gluconolactonase
VITSGLRFPEGPFTLSDGSVVLCEIAGGCLTRVTPDGTKTVVAQLGGGPNGAAIGPGGACFVCNNGGLSFNGPVSEEAAGSIQKVDLATGQFTTLYRMVNGRPLIRPNDIVFDRTGGFWFTDPGRGHARNQDYGGIYWGRADGSEIKEVIFPSVTCNGIALSPDGKTLYVAGVPGARQIAAFEIAGPGELAMETSWVEFGRQHTGRRPKARLVVSLGGDQGFDSMRVDSAGNLIVGTTVMGGLTIVSPDGNKVEHLPMPDPMTTNLAFGGPDWKTAFVCLSSRGELVAIPWPRPGLRLAYQ